MSRIACIVLAAGLSSRMGQSKLLLPWGEHSVIFHVTQQAQRANFSDIVIITGHENTSVEKEITSLAVDVIFNPEYEQGEMLSSLKAGIKYISEKSQDIDAVAVLLGDLPLLTSDLLNSILEQHKAGKITAPEHDGKRGHPIIFDRKFWDDILQLSPDSAPHDTIKNHRNELNVIQVNNDAVYRDIDTPDTYQACLIEGLKRTQQQVQHLTQKLHLMPQIVECVPNFSEGRRLDVINNIVESIAKVENVAVLHQTSDADHNRTVVTFAGEPQAVVEAAFNAIQTAAQFINLDEQQGVHPRLGTTDVVPFVPIQGISLEACAELARQLGKRVAEELNIPVYLYEAAATRPERQNLADVRRGEYELLKQEIHLPLRKPDFGEPILGSAGATIIGARDILIAYNVFLDTDDVTIAKEIARKIRFSSGGFAGVKALGLFVNGQAQVSMNIVDYRTTSVYTVMEAIYHEAEKHNVQVIRSELIGLIPRDAIIDTAASFLNLPDLKPNRLLENQIENFFTYGTPTNSYNKDKNYP